MKPVIVRNHVHQMAWFLDVASVPYGYETTSNSVEHGLFEQGSRSFFDPLPSCGWGSTWKGAGILDTHHSCDRIVAVGTGHLLGGRPCGRKHFLPLLLLRSLFREPMKC